MSLSTSAKMLGAGRGLLCVSRLSKHTLPDLPYVFNPAPSSLRGLVLRASAYN